MMELRKLGGILGLVKLKMSCNDSNGRKMNVDNKLSTKSDGIKLNDNKKSNAKDYPNTGSTNKWDPSVILDRKEPNTLPLWIKLVSLPLEAWSNAGLSALASRIGTPLIMDTMTIRMCNKGVGSLGCARVLVEANADKGLEDHIDVLYKRKDNVFGDSESKCPKLSKTEEKGKESMKDLDEDMSTFKIRNREKEEVEKYVLMELQPSSTGIELDENDVYIDKSGTAAFMTINEVSGMDMIDFHDCVNALEIKDVNSYGFHFTWTKSLLNPNAKILKKIDK
nr:RNA-directed DNA polymerase, eukaryota, reverse transcriptase zinc-binding domain protein [Tanacetum cinerariifolium]